MNEKKNQFIKVMREHSNEELQNILTRKRTDYVSDALEAAEEVLKERGVEVNLYSHPLKSQFLRDIVLTHYLAYFLEHAPKSFHCSFEVIGRCRQKNVHSISHHTFIKVAAQSVI